MTDADVHKILETQFSPVLLKVTDESYKHVGHPETLQSQEKCFDLLIVSKAFEGKTLLQRHSAVYQALRMGKNEEIHGLTVHAYSISEWENSTGQRLKRI